MNLRKYITLISLFLSKQYHFRIKCHKIHVAKWSPVFAAMFQHPSFVESTNNQIVIDDFDPETVVTFIDYLYAQNPSATIKQSYSRYARTMTEFSKVLKKASTLKTENIIRNTI